MTKNICIVCAIVAVLLTTLQLATSWFVSRTDPLAANGSTIELDNLRDERLAEPQPVIDLTGSRTLGIIDKISEETVSIRDDAGSVQTYAFPKCVIPNLPTSTLLGDVSTHRKFHGKYPIRDLRVGDRVEIEFYRLNRELTCHHVSILRRPGGIVPRSLGDIPGDDLGWFAHHRRMNAFQGREEEGIPLPDVMAHGFGISSCRKKPLRSGTRFEKLDANVLNRGLTENILTPWAFTNWLRYPDTPVILSESKEGGENSASAK